MKANWTAVYERKDDGWVAYCQEDPAAGVHEPTLSDARQSLRSLMKQRIAEQEAEMARAENPLADQLSNPAATPLPGTQGHSLQMPA